MKGWHFLQENRRLRYGSKEIVEVGGVYRCEGPITLCRNGMHASKRAIDALGYAPGPVVCRVDLTVDIVTGNDKFAGRERRVLKMVDATAILHEFGCRCAEDALALIDKPDPRSVAAIQAKRDWLAGKITGDELAAARYAAWYASAAACAATRDAAWAAAGDAAWYAASDAAWDASDAASDAASAAQNKRLTSMITAAINQERRLTNDRPTRRMHRTGDRQSRRVCRSTPATDGEA